MTSRSGERLHLTLVSEAGEQLRRRLLEDICRVADTS